jgi:POT family proton-dependent oligopeptide transporter
MEQTIQKGHPKGLYLLFVTEMWERFSYYGMRAILMLFMTKALLFDSEFASGLYGNYTGLVYLTPLIGGYISDRYWGNRKSILVGGIIMAIGQFMLFFSASSLGTSFASIAFYIGLLSLIIGNGFFKPNISTMVNQLYAPGDKRVDGAFSIFYMGINLGAFFSPLVCGTLAEKVDYRWGFWQPVSECSLALLFLNYSKINTSFLPMAKL